MRPDPVVPHPPSSGFQGTGRRSIRLKGHDYAGGGVYFVTLCAHREAIAAWGGAPFGAPQARALIEERMRITAEKVPQMRWGEWVIMPDHLHALVRMQAGPLRLGDVIGGFKAAVSREWGRVQAPGVAQGGPGPRATQVSPVRRGEAGLASCFAPRIWHRNYYEMIVRSDAAERRIATYIRMNPWRCVQELGGGLRGIGNPALWNGQKLGVLCSRAARATQGATQVSPGLGATQVSPVHVPRAEVYFGGWHSPKEKAILAGLLHQGQRVIACPAWGIKDAALAPDLRKALEENRLLLLEMRDTSGSLAAAEARNRFVIEHADTLFTPYIAAGGMLDRLLKERAKVNP